jgi:hypothetical protein
LVYQFDPQQAPDDQFVPGELRHLVSGNEGRLLDPRRTPVRIVELDLPTGQFVVELLAFEDRGARWQMPLEHADRFQFARGCAEADAAEISRFEAIVARLDRPLAIAADPARRRDAEARLSSLREGAGEWLAANSEFLASGATPDFVGHTGAPALWRDLRAFMEAADLWDLEDAFAERYVRNPRSGELVKGHRIVIAELGLVAYDGDPRCGAVRGPVEPRTARGARAAPARVRA